MGDGGPTHSCRILQKVSEKRCTDANTPYLMLPIKDNEHTYCYFFKIGSIPKEKNTIEINNY